MSKPSEQQTEFANCVVCSGQAFGRMACTHCETKMRDQLTDILEFYALAEGELEPGKSGTGGGSERSIGVRVAALDFLAGHDAVAVLGLWEREWQEHYELTIGKDSKRPAVTLLSAVTFLKAWLPTACMSHPAIDDFAQEVRESWQIARAAARMYPPRKTLVQCPADVEVEGEILTCGQMITIRNEQFDDDVFCRGCSTKWNPRRLIAVALSTVDTRAYADADAVLAYFGLPASTLRTWGKSGRIKTSHGRYELRSIQAAIEADREIAYSKLLGRVVGGGA